MPRYKLTLSYDGTKYVGWQIQQNGLSIQAVVQKALSLYFRTTPFHLTGSGRTDSGVHALAQTAHFDAASFEKNEFLYALKAMLPPDIRALDVEEVPIDFHARYSATGKIYRYHINLEEDPFSRLYAWTVRYPLSEEALFEGAKLLIGKHDFKGFSNDSSSGIASYDSVRTLRRLDITCKKKKIILEFEGDGFLRQMARNCTGTLVDIARGHMPLSTIPAVFASNDRRAAGQTAPAKGLFLVKVQY